MAAAKAPRRQKKISTERFPFILKIASLTARKYRLHRRRLSTSTLCQSPLADRCRQRARSSDFSNGRVLSRNVREALISCCKTHGLDIELRFPCIQAICPPGFVSRFLKTLVFHSQSSARNNPPHDGRSLTTNQLDHRILGATCSMNRRIDARAWPSVKPPIAKFPARSVR